ncbi:hypothetical protein IAT38_004880 [Cryptococcus sp. DSM 104549]
MSSSSTSAQAQPRRLTLEEMWAGYDKMTEEMKVAWHEKDRTIPDHYPSRRTTYKLLSPADTVEHHLLRLCKQSIREGMVASTLTGQSR